MKQLNEIKRMQQLAGILKEDISLSQYDSSYESAKKYIEDLKSLGSIPNSTVLNVGDLITKDMKRDIDPMKDFDSDKEILDKNWKIINIVMTDVAWEEFIDNNDEIDLKTSRTPLSIIVEFEDEDETEGYSFEDFIYNLNTNNTWDINVNSVTLDFM